ncbi:MAG: HlyD family secretion protein [Hyphomicrobiaceae bacterium]
MLAALAILVIAGGGAWYWHYTSLHPSTSDAYVGAHVVRVAPLVSGRVSAVRARTFQPVKAGDILVEIDQAPLKAALEGARARLAEAKQEAAATAAAVTAAEAQVAEARATLVDQRKQTQRTVTLTDKGAATKAERDDAEAKLKSAEAGLRSAEAALTQARQHLGAEGDQNAAVRAAAATVTSAELDLEHATIRAPADGIVGEVEVRPGAVVDTGMAMFPLVETGRWWVDANFKETDLTHIRPGQAARVTLDLYPSRQIRGRVESISPASGAAFALLPPENASGNWVKVTQRFPVRILLETDNGSPPLRIGASSSVEIDLTAGAN